MTWQENAYLPRLVATLLCGPKYNMVGHTNALEKFGNPYNVGIQPISAVY